MSFTAVATDRLVALARDLIVKTGELTAANEAANARAASAIADLERFRATDAAEDQVQLAEQDARLASEVDAKRAELETLIADGTKDEGEAEAEPAAEPEPAVETPEAPVVDAPADEQPAPSTVDESVASEDASVVVDVPAPAETPEDGVVGELGAGEPAVETPHAGEGTLDVEEAR